MKKEIMDAVKECEGNLVKKGFEIVDISKHSYATISVGEKKLFYVVVRNHGTFLVDYNQQKIKHYLRSDEKPTPEKVQEIIEELKSMAKKIKLIDLF